MPSVLVVDDSLLDRSLAVGLLEKLPEFTIYQAVDGQDAIDQLELHLPDLVVTDMMMPNMNGLELVSEVREHYPLIPIILMTSAGSEELAVQALQRGAASYVPKRALGSDLLEIVDRVLAGSHELRGRARLMNRLNRYEASFTLENDLSLIVAVAAYLREDAMRIRLCPRTECLRLGVAVEEALLNAFYHGNLEISSELRERDHHAYHDLAMLRSTQNPYGDRRIHVRVAITQTEAIYTIRDEGPGFDPTQLPDPTDPMNLDRPCGRGLLLMRTFMNRVEYNATGNEVRLTKIRSAEPELVEEPEPVEV
ncbi:MAG: response regulator [Planctomycetaceae bacterium]|nr:MAG: response regulator [Planctomycetaceae bacterium]